MPLPEDWRARFTAMVTGEAPLDGSWFAGSDRLSPQDQIAVYRRQHDLRFPEALEKNFQGLSSMSGGTSWLERFLKLNNCTTWTLEGAGRGMADFMRDHGAPDHLVEMAAMDEAVGRGFLEHEGPPVTPEALMLGPELRLSPHVTLLRHRFDVHRWRSVALGGESPEALIEGDYPVVVYRKQRRMKHIIMPSPAFALLTSIHLGLDEALGAAAAVDAELLQANVRDWFQLFTSRGLLQVHG